MKAVRIHEHGGTDVLVWEEITDPVIKPDQVLVQIKAASINHLDIWVRRGIPGISLPMILGSDAAGIIKEVDDLSRKTIVGLSPVERKFLQEIFLNIIIQFRLEVVV